MLNGDISNQSPARLIVVADVAVQSEIREKRGILNRQSGRVITGYNNLELSQLWNMSNKYGLSLELAAFEEDYWTEELLEQVMARLENRGGNPFNVTQLYLSITDFVGELPYRDNLKGVVDIRGRVMRYGSLGIELGNL